MLPPPPPLHGLGGGPVGDSGGLVGDWWGPVVASRVLRAGGFPGKFWGTNARPPPRYARRSVPPVGGPSDASLATLAQVPLRGMRPYAPFDALRAPILATPVPLRCPYMAPRVPSVASVATLRQTSRPRTACPVSGSLRSLGPTLRAVLLARFARIRRARGAARRPWGGL